MDEFLAACGAACPIRLEIDDGTGEPRTVVLARPFAVVGNDPSADLRLDHEQVSQRHAYFQVLGGRLWAIDLGSRSGLQWRHGRPAGRGPLDPGETLGIGPFTIRRPADEPPVKDDGLRDPLRERLPGPPPVLDDPADGDPASWPLTRAVNLVGRSPLCRIRLEDDSVSRTHAALLRTTAGLWIVDLLGRGGVSINGHAARYGRLEPGDVLGVGRFQLRLRAGSGSEARPDDATWSPDPVGLPALATAARSVLTPIRPDLIAEVASGQEREVSPVLLLFIEQMGRMQQQMLDQFQQAMRMVFELIGERQRQDREQIREEVDRLRHLADELDTLKGRLNAPARDGSDKPATGSSTRERPAPAAADRAVVGPASPVSPQSPNEPSGNSLAWVCGRLHEMQAEQQQRWARVTRLLKGSD